MFGCCRRRKREIPVNTAFVNPAYVGSVKVKRLNSVDVHTEESPEVVVKTTNCIEVQTESTVIETQTESAVIETQTVDLEVENAEPVEEGPPNPWSYVIKELVKKQESFTATNSLKLTDSQSGTEIQSSVIDSIAAQSGEIDGSCKSISVEGPILEENPVSVDDPTVAKINFAKISIVDPLTNNLPSIENSNEVVGYSRQFSAVSSSRDSFKSAESIVDSETKGDVIVTLEKSDTSSSIDSQSKFDTIESVSHSADETKNLASTDLDAPTPPRPRSTDGHLQEAELTDHASARGSNSVVEPEIASLHAGEESAALESKDVLKLESVTLPPHSDRISSESVVDVEGSGKSTREVVNSEVEPVTNSESSNCVKPGSVDLPTYTSSSDSVVDVSGISTREVVNSEVEPVTNSESSDFVKPDSVDLPTYNTSSSDSGVSGSGKTPNKSGIIVQHSSASEMSLESSRSAVGTSSIDGLSIDFVEGYSKVDATEEIGQMYEYIPVPPARKNRGKKSKLVTTF